MKKTKFMTRLGAVVFALAILFAMAVPAFAVGETGDTYSGNSQTTVNPTNNTIPLKKAIVVFNPEANLDVRLPATTYTYTVEPFVFADGTTHPTVTDTDGDVAVVNSGVEYGVTGATISFDPTTDSVAAKSAGTEFEKGNDLTVVFNNNGTPTFTHAGIYRYVVTEANDALAADGILRDSTYSPVRYLDVYIANNGDNLVLYGAVFFTTQISSNDGTPGTDSITPSTTGKTTGFEPGVVPGSGSTTADYANDPTVDKYYTYNLEVTKTITGNMADKNHQFPITVSMTKASGLTDNATVDFSVSATKATGTAASVALGTNVNFTANLADGGSMYIKGIPYYTDTTAATPTPAYATVNSITDENDTVDSYKPSIVSTSHMTGGLAFADVATAANHSATTTNSTYARFVADQYDETITINNNMEDISPTGLAFRVAPYVLMLAAGISLVLIFAKRRREITDMI